MTVTDRTAATPEEFAARIAPFESASTPPEVREVAVLEEVARALTAPMPEWRGGPDADYWRMRAAAAVAAYRAQGGGAEAFAAAVLRAAAQEQRNEAEQVPDTDEGTHADGHRCAADFLDRRANHLDPR